MRLMKHTYILPLLSIAGMLCKSCDKNPLETEQYKKMVYIVGAQNMDRVYELKMEYNATEWTDTFISVACSGSQLTEHDLKVSVEIDPEGVDLYNDRYHPNDIDPENKLSEMDAANYQIETGDHVIKAGETYVRIPIKINTKAFAEKPLAVIPMRIASAGCEISQDNSHVLLKVIIKDPESPFAGNYVMTGQRIDYWWGNHSAENTTWTGRIMSATRSSEKTVTLLADTPDQTTDATMETLGITFSFNDDNTVSVASYTDGGCLVGQYNSALPNWEGYWSGCADPAKPIVGTYTYNEETGEVVITVDYAFIQTDNCCYGFRGTYTKITY